MSGRLALEAPKAELWAGEIGPHNGHNPGCSHGSMRWANWGDTFWYLDAMATKAANGYSVFCRQDFVGIDYGIVDCSTYDPLPDYFGGVLFGRLMGRGVLSVVQVSGPEYSGVRPLHTWGWIHSAPAQSGPPITGRGFAGSFRWHQLCALRVASERSQRYECNSGRPERQSPRV